MITPATSNTINEWITRSADCAILSFGSQCIHIIMYVIYIFIYIYKIYIIDFVVFFFATFNYHCICVHIIIATILHIGWHQTTDASHSNNHIIIIINSAFNIDLKIRDSQTMFGVCSNKNNKLVLYLFTLVIFISTCFTKELSIYEFDSLIKEKKYLFLFFYSSVR